MLKTQNPQPLSFKKEKKKLKFPLASEKFLITRILENNKCCSAVYMMLLQKIPI